MFYTFLGIISRATEPILGLFVLILTYWYAESKFDNENLNFENVWKCWKVLVCRLLEIRMGGLVALTH